MPRSEKKISYYNSSHTRIQLQAAAARGLDCCWAAGLAWCSVQKEGKKRVPSTSVCIRVLRTYTGMGDAETQCCGNPGICHLSVPKAKKVQKLATRDTLHGSRPNLQQHEPDGRIVPTPSDVWDKGASTKRYARRKKTNHNYTYTYSSVNVKSRSCYHILHALF